MKALFAAAILAATLTAAPVFAQDGGADPHAPGAYAGAGKAQFYNVDDRLAAMEAKAATLPAGQARRAKAQLAMIRGFEKQQMARHGGELRDWDREAMNTRMDKLQGAMPGLG